MRARSSRGSPNVRPAAAFSMAGLLGFGGPKRLVLTFLAMATVSEAGRRHRRRHAGHRLHRDRHRARLGACRHRDHRGGARRGDAHARSIVAHDACGVAACLALPRDRRCAAPGWAPAPVRVSPGARQAAERLVLRAPRISLRRRRRCLVTCARLRAAHIGLPDTDRPWRRARRRHQLTQTDDAPRRRDAVPWPGATRCPPPSRVWRRPRLVPGRLPISLARARHRFE